MPGINLDRKLQEVERPNGARRASVFDGQLALNLTPYSTQHSVIGTFMGAALADYRESEEYSNECEHSRTTRGPLLD